MKYFWKTNDCTHGKVYILMDLRGGLLCLCENFGDLLSSFTFQRQAKHIETRDLSKPFECHDTVEQELGFYYLSKSEVR